MAHYFSQTQIDDARNALGFGVSAAQIAAQLGVTEKELRRLLGLPDWELEDIQKQTNPARAAD